MKNKSDLEDCMTYWKESINKNENVVMSMVANKIDSYKDSNGLTHYVINKKYVIYEIQEKKE